MNIKMMRSKHVAIGVKNGMTFTDFCAKYNCSAEEFEERMKQIYKDKKQLRGYYTQIATNEKRARKEIIVEATEISDVAENLDETQLTVVTSRCAELDYLTELEGQQSKRVMALESEHKSLAAEHRGLKSSLRELSEGIDKLMVEVQTYHQKFEEILSRNTIVETRMTDITSEWNTERAALNDIRSRIEELSVVTLSVYASGEISPMDGCEIELDETGWESVKDTLLEKDECQELKVKEVSTLAKLLKIVEHIAEHSERRVEVICDNSELENAFQKLR